MAEELRKFIAPEFVFGEGAIDLVGQYARNFGGDRVLLVSDPGVSEAGWTARACNSLKSQGLQYLEYLEVSPNPRDFQVRAGAEVYLANDCDMVVAVGGGSPMDCAKGIGIVVANGGAISDYEGADRVEMPIPPLICVPTTAGSSADVSQFAIVTDTSRALKMAIVSKAIVPDVSLIDPTTLTTATPGLTMSAGVDALVHAIEAYVSNAASPFTDLHALEAIRLIHQSLPLVLAHPQEQEFKSLLMRGSLEAGLAFSNASLGAVHAMAHALGGQLDFPHGECNARLLSVVVRENYARASDRYQTVFHFLGRPLTAVQPLEWFEEYLLHLLQLGNLEPTWPRHWVTEDILDRLVQNALADPCMVTNPRRFTQDEVRDLYVRLFR